MRLQSFQIEVKQPDLRKCVWSRDPLSHRSIPVATKFGYLRHAEQYHVAIGQFKAEHVASKPDMSARVKLDYILPIFFILWEGGQCVCPSPFKLCPILDEPLFLFPA